MGNKIARTTQASASEYYLHDLPSSYNLVLKEVLGRGRFFKSILCKHDEGLVLVKVYFKRGDYIDLREYERRLFEIKDIFKNVHHSHVWPFQYWLETDKAAYLLRQYFFNNLLDRLSTRPFLSNIEKKWIAFQLLYAVKQSHENGVCHGDIKCENVVVTSWNWVYLADFASFKPTYIPDDDPSDFSFFFDTGGRRRCYLAPERFHEPGGEVQYASDAPLEPSMDIFSLGCVLAELFLEGQPLFELSQLLSYRRGQYDPGQLLEKIPDAGIRKMILHMIQLDPVLRLSAESYLQDYTPSVFPTYFSPFLHKFFSCLSPLDSDTRVAVTQGAFNEILKQMLKGNEDLVTNSDSVNGSTLMNVDNGEQNLNMEKISSKDGIKLDKGHLAGELASLLADVEKSTGPSYTSNKFAALLDSAQHAQHPGDDLKKHSKKPTKAIISTGFLFKSSTPFKRISKNELYLLVSNYDNQLDTFGIALFPESENNLSCEGMVLIAALLCSCLRSVKLPQLRRAAILLLRSASFCIDDEDRLQHVIPYVIAMLSDSTAIVRCAAIDTLCDVLPLIQDFPPSDAKIFPEYILPMLSTLPDDTEESVRICYASNIYKIALTAYRFLVHSQKHSEEGILDKASSPKKSAAHLQLSQLRKSIAEVVQELVMGPKQTLNIRRALLQDIVYLCCFFGQRQCNDFLLPILPAFLNDRDEQLKALFYDEIVFVCFSVGQRSVEEYLLPYIDQALSETAEPVIVNALECLVLLCGNGVLRKSVLLNTIKRAFPLLCHPSHWVRRLAVRLITTSCEKLGPVDSYVYLSPVLRTFLHREPSSLSSEESLLSCLKPPVSRQVFYQVLETAQSSDMLERQRKIWYSSSAYSKQCETIDLNQKAGEGLNAKLELEDASKFRAKGSFARTSASGMDIRDPLCSDKLQFSGFISPHVSAGNSLTCDGPSEGIPLYSLSIDRRSSGAGTTQPSSLSQWNTVGAGASSMPWIDPSNKSFTLARSTSPKLVSGSFFSINNGSKPVYKVVQDAQVKESDQIDVTTGKLNDMNISVAANGSSSISIEDAATFPENSGVASLSRGTIVPDPGWRPRGVLVAHLQEHRSAVNDIAVSNDHSFFVSASDDSTVKIWDTRKLEKDISFRSRLTYPLDNTRALCATLLRGSSQVVVGSSDGSIHMFSVDYISKGLGNVVERYSGIADIKRKEVGEGPILSLMNYSLDGIASNSILYSTRSSQVHLLDLRINSITWTLKSNPEEGFVSSFVTGPCGNWLVSGSSRGVLTLWDLRFLIPVNTWQLPVATPVEKMCLFIPHALGPTSSPLRPLVYVAAGCNELSLWNAENGSCYQVLKAADTSGCAEINDIPWALARSSAKSNSKQAPKSNINQKYRVDELNAPPSRLPGIRSLLPLPGGDLLSGGTDMRIRRWDHSSPDKSYSVCGPSKKGLGKDEVYETKNSFGIQVVQEITRGPGGNKLSMKAIHTAAATDSAGCHRDAILSISSAKLNQRLLISSSRDGAIKVWK